MPHGLRGPVEPFAALEGGLDLGLSIGHVFLVGGGHVLVQTSAPQLVGVEKQPLVDHFAHVGYGDREAGMGSPTKFSSLCTNKVTVSIDTMLINTSLSLFKSEASEGLLQLLREFCPL